MKSIQARLGVAFLCMIVLLFIQGGVAYHHIKTIAGIHAEALEHQMHINEVKLKLAGIRLLVFEVLGTMDPAQMDQLRLAFEKARTYLEKALAEESMDPDAVEKNFGTYEKIIGLHYNFHVRSARTLIYGASKSLHNDLESALDVHAQRVTSQHQSSIAHTYRQTLHVTLGLLAVALVIAVFLAVVMARSLIDKRQAEEVLKQSEEKYRALVNTAPYGIQLTDPEGKIQFSNPAHHKIQGYEEGGLIGKYFWELIAEEPDRQEARAYYRYIIEEKPAPEIVVNTDRTQDGRLIDTQINWDYLYGPEGRVEGIISVITDITDRRRLENQLRQAQKMEAVGNLAGGIAHDFNNILFPILGVSEMLLEDFKPHSVEYQSLQQIFKAAMRGSDLVKQILAFSRQSEHRRIPVKVQKVLKEVLKLSRSTIPVDISIEQNIQQDCGLVMADPTQLHQIAMNLITNAYHAVSPEGGTISVDLREIVLGPHEVITSSLKPGAHVLLSIRDTGCGIDPSLMDKIFDPYFTTKEQGKGTGLGLAVVHGIVKEHQGEILVTSRPGKGATFKVYLPLLEKEAPPPATQKPAPHKTGTERILLVDDEEAIVRLETQMLERLGYRVTAFTSSVDALRHFRDDPDAFDLLVTDMTMPNMTGDRLAREVMGIRPKLPVIICTGFSERLNEEKATAMGIRGFLNKPIVKMEMAERVRCVLDEAAASAPKQTATTWKNDAQGIDQ